ncbi:putative hypothetical protein [Clostridium botulinum BKT015925]|nr:putative hypothetical protein [Clostridium botulinum BKT015925]
MELFSTNDSDPTLNFKTKKAIYTPSFKTLIALAGAFEFWHI